MLDTKIKFLVSSGMKKSKNLSRLESVGFFSLNPTFFLFAADTLPIISIRFR